MEKEREKNAKTDEEINKILKIERKKEICSHVKDENILKDYKQSLGTKYKNTTIREIDTFREKMAYVGICLICGEQLYNE